MFALGYDHLCLAVETFAVNWSLLEKVELVKEVIINLARNVESSRSTHDWSNIPIEKYLQKDQEAKSVRFAVRAK